MKFGKIAPCQAFCQVDVRNPREVGKFMDWLVVGSTWIDPDEPADKRAAARGSTGDTGEGAVHRVREWTQLPDGTWEQPKINGDDAKAETAEAWTRADLEEVSWSWQAPRHRMVKLLWQMLTGLTSQQDFMRHFTEGVYWLEQDSQRCGELLPQIQAQLKKVMRSIEMGAQRYREIGQAQFGEEWYMPEDAAAIMRQQLTKAHVDLLQQPSDYLEATQMHMNYLIRHVAQFIDPPIADPERAYVGEIVTVGEERSALVWIEAGDERSGLINIHHPVTERPGRGFGWGYLGSGAQVLAASMLADAFEGDIKLATDIVRIDRSRASGRFFGGIEANVFPISRAGDFVMDVVGHLPADGLMEPFRLSSASVRDWFRSQPGGEQQLERYRSALQRRKKMYGERLASELTRVERVRSVGPLYAQRFDLVPTDFEAALYVDLMEALRRGLTILKCSLCGDVIPDRADARSNHQRSRGNRGESIYHAECFAKVRRAKKREDYKQRAADPKFREARKLAARQRRRLK